MATPRVATPTPGNAWGPLPPHASPARSRGAVSRWTERLLLVIALVSLGYYSYVTAEAYLYQAYETRELDAILQNATEPPTGAATVTSVRRRPATAQGSPIGRIEIPRLGVSAVVRAGADARTLRLAVGHIAGTAFPGDRGNVGLAGHRDTFFRKLRDIRPGDVIRVVTPDGTFTYRVSRTNIVNPGDVWVLDPTDQPVLTLVTCYPFSYVGSAPQRFIVRAALDSDTRTAALAR
jgi:sortase A